VLLFTCKVFEGPAREKLWSHIPHLNILAHLLPSEVKIDPDQCKYALADDFCVSYGDGLHQMISEMVHPVIAFDINGLQANQC
jgi:hypothetical protein